MKKLIFAIFVVLGMAIATHAQAQQPIIFKPVNAVAYDINSVELARVDLSMGYISLDQNTAHFNLPEINVNIKITLSESKTEEGENITHVSFYASDDSCIVMFSVNRVNGKVIVSLIDNYGFIQFDVPSNKIEGLKTI